MKMILLSLCLILLGNMAWGQWTEPQIFPVEHGSAVAGPWISNDNLRMYANFTSYIFMSERASVDSAWTPFHTVGDNINSGVTQGSPCESPSGDTLYFQSWNRPEGSFGGYDIYYTIRTENNDWLGPIYNCGPNINSQYMEWSVGISRDGSKLLVAANRIPGHGGNDIYYSDKQENNEWGPLIDFGDNINTWDREEHPSMSPNGRRLVFFRGGLRMGDLFISEYDDNLGWELAYYIPEPISTLQWTETDPCIALDGRTLYFLSDVGDDNDFQIYSSVDTTVLSLSEPRQQRIGIEPTLICSFADAGILNISVYGLGFTNRSEITIYDVLGRTVMVRSISFVRDGKALHGNIILPTELASGAYIATLKANNKTLSNTFKIIH